jgi:hypothetical protein
MSEALGQLVEELGDAVARRVLEVLRAEIETMTGSNPAELWQLLTVAEVSERLGRSSRWVRERAKEGSLPWVKLDSGPLAFLPDDVEAFARARRVPAEDDGTLTRRLPGGREGARVNGSRADGRLKEPGVEREERL